MHNLKMIYSAKTIQTAVELLQDEIYEDKGLGKKFNVLCVLKGAYMFCADLVRGLEANVKVDFIQASSYKGRKSSGEINITHKPTFVIRDEPLLIVEDIVETGLTLGNVVKYVDHHYEPGTIRIVSLLWKVKEPKPIVEPDYWELKCPDEFVVGYGLDYNEQYRHLPQLYTMQNERRATWKK